MRRRGRLVTAAVLAVVTSLFLIAAPASAITNGSYDGSDHPYVGYETNGTFSCTGTLLSPTVMLTAAHCFSDSPSVYGTNPATGAPLVLATFTPDLASAPRTWYVGSYYSDPRFSMGGNGLPHFDTHDVAVIVFTAASCPGWSAGSDTVLCGPVPASATAGQYGRLPTTTVVDGLRSNASIDLVGYGVQGFTNGGGPCAGPCTKQQVFTGTRAFATSSLVASQDAISGEFLKLHANKGGVCFGDSGGPDLGARSNVVLAVNSFVQSDCTGITYSYRVDTPDAQAWIRATVATAGGAL